jgi:hypothetical protein
MSHSRSDPGTGSGPPRYPGTFLLAFREAIAELNWEVRRWKGHLVECVDAEGNERIVGLENLYRRARQIDRAEWPALAAEFLRTAGNIDDTLPEDLACVAEQLLVRVGPPIQSMPNEARVWSQELDATGLHLNLVIDYPDRMFYVTAELVERSGKPGQEWVKQALANLQARTPSESLQVIHDETGLMSCDVADAYDSSRALILDALLPDCREHGCFVTIPGRDHLLVLPVGLESLSSVHLLKVLAEQNYKSTPYAISDQVYWVRHGVWRLFAIEMEGEKVTVTPPEEFVEVLRELAAEAAADGEPGPNYEPPEDGANI